MLIFSTQPGELIVLLLDLFREYIPYVHKTQPVEPFPFKTVVLFGAVRAAELLCAAARDKSLEALITPDAFLFWLSCLVSTAPQYGFTVSQLYSFALHRERARNEGLWFFA